jgi:hypothetical protein
MTTSEDEYLENIDLAIQKAAKVMELQDLEVEGNGDLSEEDAYDMYEARHHCGTCEVRTVMEVVWPAVEKYVDALKSGQFHAANA